MGKIKRPSAIYICAKRNPEYSLRSMPSIFAVCCNNLLKWIVSIRPVSHAYINFRSHGPARAVWLCDYTRMWLFRVSFAATVHHYVLRVTHCPVSLCCETCDQLAGTDSDFTCVDCSCRMYLSLGYPTPKADSVLEQPIHIEQRSTIISTFVFNFFHYWVPVVSCSNVPKQLAFSLSSIVFSGIFSKKCFPILIKREVNTRRSAKGYFKLKITSSGSTSSWQQGKHK